MFRFRLPFSVSVPPSVLRVVSALFLAVLAAGAPAAPSGARQPAKKTASAKRTNKTWKPAPAKKTAPSAGSSSSAFSSKYRSPRNKQRPLRKSTRFIILHTTEGAARGALEKLSANGECHYVVDEAGRIYTIIDRGRVAYHAGLSMWNGTTDLDGCSIGIEVVGYHDKEATAAQFTALRRLVGDLKRVYKVPDERVLTHSMVAYGNPNHWQKKKHRGRKRCGMLFATAAARRKIGLAGKPAFDPDLRAKRLADADPELTRILYGGATRAEIGAPAARPSSGGTGAASGVSASPAAGADQKFVIGPKRSAWDIARDRYNSRFTVYVYPNGTKKRGDEITSREWRAMPAGTVVQMADAASEESEKTSGGPLVVGEDGPAESLAGDDAVASTTFWFRPGGQWSAGSSLTLAQISALPKGTQVLVGYRNAGGVSSKRPLFAVCGTKWNKPDTYYLIRGKLVSGDGIDEKAVPRGTQVFVRKE